MKIRFKASQVVIDSPCRLMLYTLLWIKIKALKNPWRGQKMSVNTEKILLFCVAIYIMGKIHVKRNAHMYKIACFTNRIFNLSFVKSLLLWSLWDLLESMVSRFKLSRQTPIIIIIMQRRTHNSDNNITVKTIIFPMYKAPTFPRMHSISSSTKQSWGYTSIQHHASYVVGLNRSVNWK